MKPLSAREIDQILGKRATAEERRAFRNAESKRGFIRSNRNDVKPDNPYAKLLEQLNPDSRNPAERRRLTRFRKLANEREVELSDEREADAVRQRMESDEDVQKAKSHCAQVLDTFDTQSPDDIADKNAALAGLDKALKGDKKTGLDQYYAACQQLCDRRVEEHDKELERIRQEAADHSLSQAKKEAENARMKGAALQPPHEPTQPN